VLLVQVDIVLLCGVIGKKHRQSSEYKCTPGSTAPWSSSRCAPCAGRCSPVGCRWGRHSNSSE
jgi:hypothetical protein